MERNPNLAIKRPLPPEHIGQFHNDRLVNYIPAPEVLKFVSETFIAEDAPLYNKDHEHLLGANLQFLWAAGGFEKQMRYVVGQCEKVAFRCGPWQKGRQQQQMIEWFGSVPDFLITLEASYCAECENIDFCALVEHELYHIGQKIDKYGQPAFDKAGNPSLDMRGHDVEEFIGIVERYGVGNEHSATARFIKAGSAKPTVSKLDIFHACGTCNLRAA